MWACSPRRRASRTRPAASGPSFHPVLRPTKTPASPGASHGTRPGRSAPSCRTNASGRWHTHKCHARNCSRVASASPTTSGTAIHRRFEWTRGSGSSSTIASRRTAPPTNDHRVPARARGHAAPDPRPDARPGCDCLEHRAHRRRVEALEAVVIGRDRVAGLQCVGQSTAMPRRDQPSQVRAAVALQLRERRRGQQQHPAARHVRFLLTKASFPRHASPVRVAGTCVFAGLSRATRGGRLPTRPPGLALTRAPRAGGRRAAPSPAA